MKLRKLVTGVVLCGACATMFTGCGTASNYFLSLKEASEITNYNYSITASMGSPSMGTFGLVSDGTILENGKYQMSLNLSVDATEDSGFPVSNGTYTLTDVIGDGTKIYVNVHKLFDTVAGLGMTDVEMLRTMLPNEYVELDIVDTASLATQGTAEINEEALDSTGKAMLEYYREVLTLCEKSFTDINPALISESDGTFTFTLNNENAKAVLEKLIVLIDDGSMGTLIESGFAKLEAISPDEVAEMRTSYTEAGGVAALKPEVESLIVELEEAPKFSCEGTSKLTGKAGSRLWVGGFDFTVEATDFEGEPEDALIEITFNVGEVAADTEIIFPDSYTTSDELMTMFGGMMGGTTEMLPNEGMAALDGMGDMSYYE